MLSAALPLIQFIVSVSQMLTFEVPHTPDVYVIRAIMVHNEVSFATLPRYVE